MQNPKKEVKLEQRKGTEQEKKLSQEATPQEQPPKKDEKR